MRGVLCFEPGVLLDQAVVVEGFGALSEAVIHENSILDQMRGSLLSGIDLLSIIVFLAGPLGTALLYSPALTRVPL